MTAIASVLELLRRRLDAFIKFADPRTEDWVILSNIVDHEGQVYEAAKNKIVMFLAGVQHETSISTFNRTTPLPANQFGVVTPPLYINLLVLFFANFYDGNYRDGLGMISRTVSFFQQNPLFTHDSAPDLDVVVDKLTLEIMNLDFLQANYLVGMMGVKYLPTVLYKVRMIPFRTESITGVVPAARGTKS